MLYLLIIQGYIPATIIIVRMGLALYEIDKIGMNTEVLNNISSMNYLVICGFVHFGIARSGSN